MFDIAGLNSQYIIAVDIGGTNIRTALVHENGTIITENRERTPRDSSPEAVLGVIDGLMRQEEGYARASVIVMGTPGLVNPDQGIVRKSGNLRWDNVELARMAREKWSRPVFIDNDVRLHTRGELAFSPGTKDMLVVVIGTGIAIGVVVAGKVYTGSHFAAGEIGHFTVSTRGLVCGCGKKGCLETICGVRSLSQSYRRCSGVGAEDFPARLVGGLATHDACAIAAWKVLSQGLAWALSAVLLVLDPEKVVIGGGLGVLYPMWQEYFLPVLETYLIPAAPHCEILPSVLGDRAAVYGALHLARSTGLFGLDT